MPGGPVTDKAISEEQFNLICENMSNGKSVKRTCEEFGISRGTFYFWLNLHGTKERLDKYARAMDARVEYYLDESVDISDDDTLDVGFTDEGKPFVKGENIQRSRLKIDTRIRYVEKMAPRKYGLKTQTEITGKDGGPIESKSTGEIDARILELIGRFGKTGAVESAGGKKESGGKRKPK